MSHNITKELACIQNLYNTAKHHKTYCHEPHCDVSLWHLREAAYIIKKQVIREEEDEAMKLIDDMPIG